MSSRTRCFGMSPRGEIAAPIPLHQTVLPRRQVLRTRRGSTNVRTVCFTRTGAFLGSRRTDAAISRFRSAYSPAPHVIDSRIPLSSGEIEPMAIDTNVRVRRGSPVCGFSRAKPTLPRRHHPISMRHSLSPRPSSCATTAPRTHASSTLAGSRTPHSSRSGRRRQVASNMFPARRLDPTANGIRPRQFRGRPDRYIYSPDSPVRNEQWCRI